MADQTNRIQGTVDVESNSDSRVAFDMVKYYAQRAELEGKGIDGVARLFGLFLKIMDSPYSTEDYIREFNQQNR